MVTAVFSNRIDSVMDVLLTREIRICVPTTLPHGIQNVKVSSSRDRVLHKKLELDS